MIPEQRPVNFHTHVLQR